MSSAQRPRPADEDANAATTPRTTPPLPPTSPASNDDDVMDLTKSDESSQPEQQALRGDGRETLEDVQDYVKRVFPKAIKEGEALGAPCGTGYFSFYLTIDHLTCECVGT